MASYNKVILIGNLTKDPELRYTTGGMAVVNVSIAINRKYTSGNEKKEEVDFFDIEAWDKLAELMSEWLKKGSPVLIDGRLKQDRWEDNGKWHSRVKVVAQGIQFLPSGKEKEKSEGEGGGHSDSGKHADSGDAPF